MAARPKVGKGAALTPRLARRAALLGAAGAVPALGSARTARAEGGGPRSAIAVDDFLRPGAPDDTEALHAALRAARATGGALMLSARDYLVGGTLDLPSGAQLVGCGAMGGAGPDEVPGTALRRVADCVMLRMEGHTFLDGGPMRHSAHLRGIRLDGGGFRSDIAQFVAVSRLTVDDCLFVRSLGRHLLLHEVFDSRIGNTDFDGGGTADAACPAVELRSGDGFEFTNHVHFTGCRLESYPGTAIALTGANTNKIYLTDCKLESLASNAPALTARNAVALHLAGVQVTARGTPGAAIESLLSFRDSAFVVGDVILEHAADGGGAALGAYIDLARCSGVDLRVSVIDGQDALPLASYVRLVGGEACSVRGVFRRGRHFEARSWVT